MTFNITSDFALCIFQKPLMLQGHERAITQIKYNREGDLLFSAAKDAKPNVWWSLNGERLGTFNGHGGVVWCLDVDWQTINLITGGGDSSCRCVAFYITFLLHLEILEVCFLHSSLFSVTLNIYCPKFYLLLVS